MLLPSSYLRRGSATALAPPRLPQTVPNIAQANVLGLVKAHPALPCPTATTLHSISWKQQPLWTHEIMLYAARVNSSLYGSYIVPYFIRVCMLHCRLIMLEREAFGESSLMTEASREQPTTQTLLSCWRTIPAQRCQYLLQTGPGTPQALNMTLCALLAYKDSS